MAAKKTTRKTTTAKKAKLSQIQAAIRRRTSRRVHFHSVRTGKACWRVLCWA
ncbi:hypothetical protein CA54_61230 [Symmachiella macrocystis]|uniref:Uncharacterized protein n=1 Tax=Symmachiella macrocystis TaxID=2527985 RepID=A0A5C6AV04_9PLAN|nr:hypothetical protein CA54_61230 [Symmachiella macrocystis]